MNWEQEAKLKDMAAQQCGTPYGEAKCGIIGSLDCEPARPSLRERVAMDLDRSRREARKRDRLEELAYLLEKNPELARVLDLIEEVR